MNISYQMEHCVWIYSLILPALTLEQGRRNRGCQGGPGPQVLPSALFPGAKCPFLAWKMSLRLHFLPKGHFWKLESMLFAENFCSFLGKISYILKIFLYIRKKFFIFTKKCGTSGKYFLYVRKIFWNDLPPPPRRQHFLEKIFRRLFLFEKCPSKPGPPNFYKLPTPLH